MFIVCQVIILDLFAFIKCAFYFMVKLVGGVTFLSDTIGTMITFIITEIRRNESLYTMKASNGSETVLEYISSFLCPNNCSDNGNCTSGKHWVLHYIVWFLILCRQRILASMYIANVHTNRRLKLSTNYDGCMYWYIFSD